MDNVKRFAQQYGSLAAQVGEKVGVAPEVLLGQWGLETGWGKSVVPGTNNLGNIKDFSGAGPKATDNMTGSRDAYRAYSTPQDFGSDYADLISRRYKGATGAGTDAMKYGTALKSAGYAEDPNYASKLAGATNLVRKFADMALSSVSGTANAATSGVSDKVKQARDAGYSDDEIFQHLSQSQSFADKVKQAKDAGYSDADIRQHFGLGGKTEAAKPEAKAEPRKEEPGALTNFAKGVAQGIKADIIGGPAQLLRNIVPESVGRAVDSFGNKLADLGLPIARVNGAEDLNRQIQEQEAQYQRDTDGSIAAGTGRVAANIAGALGAGGGSVVSGGGRGGQAAVRMLGGGNTAQAAGRLAGQSAGSAVLGAGTGALAPVTQEGDYGQNKLTQIATGAAIGGALPGATAAVTGAGRYTGNALRSLIDPFTEAGQTRIAGNVLNRFAEGGPIAGDVAERVVGSTPTLAQATGNPGLATLERGIQSSTPQGANAFAERAAQNAASRTDALANATGTASDLVSAKLARATNAADDYLKTNIGIPIANTEYAALKDTPAFRSAFARAQAMARNAGGTVETSVQNRANANMGGAAGKPEMYVSGQGLQIIKEALDDQIDKAVRAGANKQAASVRGVKDRLVDLMDREIPGYADARAAYAEASRPIDAMKFLQGLNLTDAQGNITLAKVQNALRNLEKNRNLPGVNEAKSVTPEQIKTLTAIRDDLLRAANSGAGKSIGSNTFQNLATNNIVENALPGPVRALMGGTNGPVGTAAGKVGNLIYGGANEAIQNRLLELMMNPQSGVAALQNVRSNQLTGPLGGNALLQRLAPNLLPAGTVGANVIARPNSQ